MDKKLRLEHGRAQLVAAWCYPFASIRREIPPSGDKKYKKPAGAGFICITEKPDWITNIHATLAHMHAR